jgi:hypothetical protein
MELEDLATSCDGDSATEKYINKIEVELARLRETEKRLREINHSLKDDNANYFSRNLELEQERDQLKAKLSHEEGQHMNTVDQRDMTEQFADRLSSSIAEALGIEIGEHSSANNPWAEAITAIEEFDIAVHDAEVIERFCDYAQTKYHFGLHSVAKDYANQLRQQANGAME